MGKKTIKPIIKESPIIVILISQVELFAAKYGNEATYKLLKQLMRYYDYRSLKI